MNQKVQDKMTARLARIQQELQAVPDQIYKYWLSQTPIRTGNARRRTRLNGKTIHAAYPYAVPLDEGSSKQSPRGMTQPTEEYLARVLKRIMRK